MKAIERRIQSIEKRIGGEVKGFVFIHNQLMVNPDGKRNRRGNDFNLSILDMEHSCLSIEYKYRNKVTGFLKDGLKQAESYHPDKIPVLILQEMHMKGELVIIRLLDFMNLFGKTVHGHRLDKPLSPMELLDN